ncbi:MAG: Retinoblastoma-binding protein 5, partial [Paramarteilia canceri]
SYIIEGSQNGCIRILSSDNLSCLASFQSCHNQVEVISIEASRNSDIFLVNCSDRVIRIFDLKSAFDSKFVQPLVEMQDQVNKVSWASAIFSCGSEYVVTCSHKHDMLFIWDIMSGTLIKTLSLHVGEKFVDLA